jgi:KDO2-lipid IV(A) lauroyltransferase
MVGTMSQKTRYQLEYWFARAFSMVARGLPLSLGQFLGASLGQVAFSMVRIRRRVTLENLQQAFSGSREKKELRKIAARCYRNLGRGVVEFCRFPTLTADNLCQILEIEGLEHCQRAMASGRGVIILSGHFGAWELLGPAFALNGYPVDLLVRAQRNPLADELMSGHRSRVGAGIIRVSRTPRGVIRSLRQNHVLVMLADQDGGRDGIFVPFLGRLASTPRGVARFAEETGAPILMSFVVRQGDRRHRLIIEPPMEIAHTGDRESYLFKILQAYTQRLESYVRTYPDQWFWPHRRWKTRPPSEVHPVPD